MSQTGTETHHREAVAPVDQAWLRMDSDTNLMMIGVVLVFDRPIETKSLISTLETRFLCFPRFRQRIEWDDDQAYWVDDPHFNLSNHLHTIGLPGNHSQKDLQDLASDLDSTPLDFNHPLWQIHLVDDYQNGCALIIRIHHCIADGIALIRVLLAMTDESPEGRQAEEPPPVLPEGWLDRLIRPIEKTLKQGARIGQDLLDEGKELIQHPSHLLDLARQGLAIGSEITRIALLPEDPDTCLKRPLSGRKSVTWAPPISLIEIKHCAHALEGTVNDILLAAACSALRRYLIETDQIEMQNDTDIHAAIPFNLRPLDKPISTLGNQFGLVVAKLPVGIEDPFERYQQVKKNMLELKHSYQAQVFYGLLGTLGKGPSVLEKTALEVLSKKASLVMTNVPGPKNPLFLAGARLLHPMVWVPQSGEVGVGLSILSYDGLVLFGLVADEAMIPAPSLLTQYFVDSVSELKKLAKKHNKP